MILSTRGIATTISAGFTLPIKLSELCPATHYEIVQALSKQGRPIVFNNSPKVGGRDAATIIETIVANPAVRRISSANVGELIAAKASKYPDDG